MNIYNIMNTEPRIISIDGNIGSGKTTLLEALREYYKHNTSVIFLREPVDEWLKIKDSAGKSMLEKFYEDQTKYSFSFQMMAYISRLAIIKKAVKQNPNAIFITERCLLTDKHVFSKMLSDQSKIEDVNYQIYLNWFNEFADDYPIESIIYVKTNPLICHERINKRSRSGEDVIPLDYLKECDKYHEDYIKEIKLVHKLNGNDDIFKNPEIVDNWLCQINQILFKN